MKIIRNRIPVKVTKASVSVPDRLRIINEQQLHAVLATDFNCQPYTSLIAFALAPDMKNLIFTTPKSTRKYKNILKNNRVSLLIDTRANTAKDYMNAESITILGNAHPLRKGRKRSEFSRIFLKKHPRLKEIMKSPETAVILIKITRCIHVTRFQSVSECEIH